MTLDISAIRQRIEKATPGEWRACLHLREETRDAECSCAYRGGIWSGDGETIICEMGGSPEVDGAKFLPEADRPQMKRDADLIAHAPADLRALCDEIEKLRIRAADLAYQATIGATQDEEAAQAVKEFMELNMGKEEGK